MRNSKYSKIRTEIKKLSEQQKLTKASRQPNSGTEQWLAQRNVWVNRNHLRHLFQAYAIIKGKERPDIKKHFYSMSEEKIRTLVKEFTPVEITQD